MDKGISDLITRLGIEAPLYTYKDSVLCLHFNSEADVLGIVKRSGLENYRVSDYNAGVKVVCIDLDITHYKMEARGTGYSIEIFMPEDAFKNLISTDLRFSNNFINVNAVLTGVGLGGAVYQNGLLIGVLDTNNAKYSYNFALPNDVVISNDNITDYIAHCYIEKDNKQLIYKGLLTPEGSEILNVYGEVYGVQELAVLKVGFLKYFSELYKNKGYEGVCSDADFADKHNFLAIPSHIRSLVEQGGYTVVDEEPLEAGSPASNVGAEDLDDFIEFLLGYFS